MGYSNRAKDLVKQLPPVEVNRPGMMLYFADWKVVLKSLTKEQSVNLLELVLQYGETGKEEEITDSMIAIAFGMLRSKIDYDRENYIIGVWQGRYAAYIKKHGKEAKPSFEDWMQKQLNNQDAEELISKEETAK